MPIVQTFQKEKKARCLLASKPHSTSGSSDSEFSDDERSEEASGDDEDDGSGDFLGRALFVSQSNSNALAYLRDDVARERASASLSLLIEGFSVRNFSRSDSLSRVKSDTD